MKWPRTYGFALADALIAAAIAAGVAIMAAQALGVAVRSARAAQNKNAIIAEAELIAARLDAGVRGDALLQGLSGWSMSETAFDSEDNNRAGSKWRLMRVRLSHAPNEFSFERVVVMETAP